jgi:hypothetical protein
MRTQCSGYYCHTEKLSLRDYVKEDEMCEAYSMHGAREMYIKRFERKISMEGKGAWVEEEC